MIRVSGSKFGIHEGKKLEVGTKRKKRNTISDVVIFMEMSKYVGEEKFLIVFEENFLSEISNFLRFRFLFFLCLYI